MAAQPLKCLFVSPVVPWPADSGGRVRTFQLLAQLSGLAEVHLRAVHESAAAAAGLAEFEGRCASAKSFERAAPGAWMTVTRPKLERWFHSPALKQALAQELARERFDLVHLDEMFLVRALPEELGTPVIVHHHKLDTDFYSRLARGRTLGGAFDNFKLRRLEAEAARKHRYHVLTNAAEASELERRYPSIESAVVESGFDPVALAPTGEPRAPQELLFLGSLDYAPNIDGLAWFVREVFPTIVAQRPNVCLNVVGSGSTEAVRDLARKGVNLIGRMGDVRPPLARASALIVPLRIGGGTRLKIVEAMGTNTPVVSTRIGAEGLAFLDPEHLWLADSATEFAARTLEVLGDPAAAQQRARRGRELALKRYTWGQLAEKMLAAWERAARA